MNKTAEIGGNTGDDQAGAVNTAIDAMAGRAIDQDIFTGMAENILIILSLVAQRNISEYKFKLLSNLLKMKMCIRDRD